MKAEKDEVLGVNKAILNYEFAMERYLEAKDNYEEAQYALRDFFESFDPVNLEDESYEFVRDFSKNMDGFCRNNELKGQVRAIKDRKMIQKYPKLLLPHFYPEINNLDVSFDDKIRLDKALRKNYGYYVSKNTYKKMGFKSLEELELLCSIGIVEKLYEFRCPDCWERMGVISAESLDLYKKAWDIKDKYPDMSDDDYVELEKLEEDGLVELAMYCDNCDGSVYIERNAEFKDIEDDMFPLYKIDKMPDLWSEKI